LSSYIMTVLEFFKCLFLHLLRWLSSVCPLILLIWYMTAIDFHKLSTFPGVNST
jgi:hypothetical protein